MAALSMALIIFLFPLAYSPGPGNMFFAANGARFGIRATIPATAGHHIATWVVTIAIGFGLLAAMEQSPLLLRTVRWAVSAYVLYLAWKFIRAGAIDSSQEARPDGVLDGAILLLLNPEAYLIIALIFKQFLVSAKLDHTIAVLWISTVFPLYNLGAFLVWTVVGDRIAQRFRDEIPTLGGST